MMTESQVRELFRFEHLPDHLQAVSKPFHDLAVQLIAFDPAAGSTAHQDTIRAEAIRMLWDAKNRIVWLAVEKHKPAGAEAK